MIPAIVVGSAILILGLAMYQPIWVRIKWGSSEKLFSVRYFLLSFHHSGKGKERAKKEKKKEKKDRNWRAILGWIRLSPKLLPAVGKGLKFLLKYGEISHIEVAGTLGTEDPAATGVLWGFTQAVCGDLSRRVPQVEMNIYPDFAEGKTNLALDSQMRLRMGGLLASAAVIVWYLPKRRLWRVIRKSKSKK